MIRVYRSKTQPIRLKQKEGFPLTWSLVPRYSPEQDQRGVTKTKFKLPKLEISINQIEKQMVNKRILKLKISRYNPVGCSKSVRLQKVRLRNKLDKKSLLQKYEQIHRNHSILSDEST